MYKEYLDFAKQIALSTATTAAKITVQAINKTIQL